MAADLANYVTHDDCEDKRDKLVSKDDCTASTGVCLLYRIKPLKQLMYVILSVQVYSLMNMPEPFRFIKSFIEWAGHK